MSFAVIARSITPYSDEEKLLTVFPEGQNTEAIKFAEEYHKTGEKGPWYSATIIYAIDFPGEEPREILTLRDQLKFNLK